METDFPLSFECESGHTIRDWSGKCDQGHNVPYYRTVECPVKLCGFHSKPGYVEDHIDKGWTQVRDHFLAAHGYRLQSEVLKESASGKNVLPPVDIGNDIIQENVVPFEASVIESVGNKDVSVDGKQFDGLKGVENKDAEEITTAEEASAREETDLSCGVCCKRMKTKFSLKRHIMQVHELQDRFECEHCDRTFCVKASLDYHIKKLHSAGEDITCEKCNESFVDFESYKIHRATQKSGKIFKCDHCGKIVKRDSYQRHISEVHEHVSRYDSKKVDCSDNHHKCSECKMAYKRKHDLDRHVKAKHTHHAFPCTVCGKEFMYANNMMRHKKMAHKEFGTD